MIIQAIKQNGREKLLAIAGRLSGKDVGPSIMCDWNTVPGSLRIFWGGSGFTKDFNGDFKAAVKYIWSLD